MSVTMTNILAWPAAPLPVRFVVRTPPAPGGPLRRETWDTLPPPSVGIAEWASARFVEYPQDAIRQLGSFSLDHPAILPGLPPWTGLEPLSTREKRWIFAPVVRHIRFCGFAGRDQLCKRAQYREAILVTRAGRKPPSGHGCTECASLFAGTAAGQPAFAECISGGIGEKCNNCLYRSTACTLQD
ncbi:hypothetical protein BDV10DRAFT_190487 [Aspergillus recurvatus]